MTQIWLIRHGESTSNAGLVTESYYQNPLTSKGETQANAVPTTIPKTPTRIIQSSYLRAQQTAAPTCNEYPQIPVDTWNVHEFVTVSPQVYNNSSMADRSTRNSSYWQNTDAHFRDAEDSESFHDSMVRVQTFKERCEQEFHDDDFVLVFCHGLFIRAFMWLQSNSPKSDIPCKQRFHYYFQSIRFPNTALLRCNLSRDSKKPEWHIGSIDYDHVPGI